MNELYLQIGNICCRLRVRGVTGGGAGGQLPPHLLAAAARHHSCHITTCPPTFREPLTPLQVYYSRVQNKHTGTLRLLFFEDFSRGYVLIKGGYVY